MKTLLILLIFSSAVIGQGPFYDTCAEADAQINSPWGFCDFFLDPGLDTANDEAAAGAAPCPSCEQGCALTVNDMWTRIFPILLPGDDEITILAFGIDQSLFRMELFDACNGNILFCGGMAPGTNDLTISGIISEQEYFLRIWYLDGATSGNIDICIGWAQAIIPVEISEFSGKQKDDFIALIWRTISEINNDGFHVLRSTNGNTWEKIAYLDGAGTSNEVNNYLFTDKSPQSGNNYYKLEQVDFNGVRDFSDQIVVNFKTRKKKVGPNPTHDFIYVEENTEIVLFNLVGEKVLSGKSRDGKIDLSKLHSGLYLIKTGNTIERIIKE